jgi:hypothetical protein
MKKNFIISLHVVVLTLLLSLTCIASELPFKFNSDISGMELISSNNGYDSYLSISDLKNFGGDDEGSRLYLLKINEDGILLKFCTSFLCLALCHFIT